MRALAVTAPQRQPAFPHLPAISEYLPGFELVPWFGLFGSRGVAPAQFAQMSEWVDQVLRAAFKGESSETSLSGWTNLGLYELVRKRDRLPLAELLGVRE